jgi:hypothetical protein
LANDLDPILFLAASCPIRAARPKGPPTVSFFYEIRSSTNTVLKRDGGFADVEAAKSAALLR